VKRHHLARVAALVAVLTAAAVLVPSPAVAHAHAARPAYRIPAEQAQPRGATLRLMPALNRGTMPALPSDSELARFGRRA
jgi:hypothetical protein